MNIKLIISYDGTRYFGWQKTKAGPSIQEALEKALLQIVREHVIVEAASRTDRGVHAKQQIVNFILTKPIPLPRLLYSLNSVLPSDIRGLEIERVCDEFHPTVHALKKEYRYYINLRPVQDPLSRLYTWHIYEPLDLEAMHRAASLLIGTHDFASFTTMKIDDTMRTLFNVQILTPSNDQIEIRILGDRFLYKMARRLVGTLVAVGKQTLSESEMSTLLSQPNRAKAGMTAPANGLFLYQVYYI
ncbi:MAG: tRNA pseudouridine(38-40) synthase TruA [Chlamydiales bacterium]|nr:tRNA pseudouridine(38-40) synthase TruA [Chlamydiales bacterium]